MTGAVVLFDIDYTLFDTDLFKSSNLSTHSLYEESIKVIEKLSTVADLGIFSEGEEGFQMAKLIKTDILQYFHEAHVHIFDKKDDNLDAVLKKYEGRSVYMVDDKLSVLKLAKSIRSDVVTIWVKRGIYAQNQPNIGFTPDLTVATLVEAEEYIYARES